MVTVNNFISTWIGDLLAFMGTKSRVNRRESHVVEKKGSSVKLNSSGCFGCCAKPTPIIAVDEPSKGLRIQGRIVRKPSISDDFWSTSTYDLENSAVQSQRSVSSISVTNPTLSQCSSTGGVANPTDFVNQGKFYFLYSLSCLIVWNQTRLQWIGSSRPRNHTKQSREPRLSWNATYESLLGTRSPFRQSIPLSEMIDFLVEVWEQEGLYD
ncbi:hypothetical protein CRYUN_Cryun26dG0079300 [Craigia yunnanensis]